MKMVKGVLILVISLCVNIFVHAQKNCILRVEQTFNGWVKCNGSHTPTWERTDLFVSDGTKQQISAANSSVDIPLLVFEKDGSFYDSESKTKLELKMELDAGEMNNSDNPDWSENFQISCGEKKYSKTISHSCGFLGLGEDGFDATIKLIFDNPVFISAKENEVIPVEDGAFVIQVNKFYLDRVKGDVCLEYYVNGDVNDQGELNWKTITNKRVVSQQEISITYDDLFGSYSEDNDEYIKNSGKKIFFRVKKRLLDGKTISYSNEISVRFYHRGPDFTIDDIRWTSCNPLHVYVNINIPKYLDKVVNNNSLLYQWAISIPNKDDDSNQNFAQKADLIFVSDNKYELKFYQQSNFFYPDYTYQLNLLLKDENGSDIDCFFPTQQFTIPKKLAPVAVSQTPEKSYPIGDKSYDLLSATNAYAVLKMTDTDFSAKGRLPYTILNPENGLEDKVRENLATGDYEETKNTAEFKNEFQKYLQDKLVQKEWAHYYEREFENWYKNNLKQVFSAYYPKQSRDLDLSNAYTNTLIDNPSSIAPQIKGLFYTGNYLLYGDVDFKGYYTCGENVRYTNQDYNLYFLDIKGDKAQDVIDAIKMNNASKSSQSYSNHLSFSINDNDCWGCECPPSINYPVYDKSPQKSLVVSLNEHGTGNHWYLHFMKPKTRSVFVQDYIDGNVLVIENGVLKNLGDDFYEYKGTENVTSAIYINNDETIYFTDVSSVKQWTKDGVSTLFDEEGVQLINYNINSKYLSNRFVLYKAKDGKTYKRQLVYSANKDDIFNEGKLYKDDVSVFSYKWWQDFKEFTRKKLYNEKYGYRFYKINDFVKDGDDLVSRGELIFTDNDGCPSEPEKIPYEVRVPAQPKMSAESVQNMNLPSGRCASDGSAKVTYSGGGVPPYYYTNSKGEKLELSENNQTIIVDGLSYGDNTVHFYNSKGEESFTLSIMMPNNDIKAKVAHDYTCSDSNGCIDVTLPSDVNSYWFSRTSTPNDTCYLSNDNGKMIDGEYILYCDFGNDCIIKYPDVLEIKNKLFTANAVPTNAKEMGKSGSVLITLENSSDVVWTDVTSDKTLNDVVVGTNWEMSAGEYKWKVSNDGCEVPVEFSIKEPYVVTTCEFIDDDRNYDEEGAKLKIVVSGVGHDIEKYSYKLSNDIQFTCSLNGLYSCDAEDDYSLQLLVDGMEDKELVSRVTIDAGFKPVVSVSDEKRCSGSDVKVNISVNDVCQYSVDEVTWFDLKVGSNETYVPETAKVIYLKKENKKNDKYLNYTYVVIRTIPLDIQPVEDLKYHIFHRNVTCYGLADGIIGIDANSIENTVGNLVYTIDGFSDIFSASDIKSDLAEGDYYVLVYDDLCPSDDLAKDIIHIDAPKTSLEISKDVVHPSCDSEDGQIAFSISGGWGTYHVKEESDFDEYDLASLLPDDAIAENKGMVYDKLASGIHKIYVIDNGGCRIPIVEELNDKIVGVDYTPVIKNVTCYDFADGSVSLTGMSNLGENAHCFFYVDGIKSYDIELNEVDKEIIIADSLDVKNEYKIVLRNDLGCIGSKTFSVEQPKPVTVELGDDVIICPGSSYICDAGNYDAYVWKKDDEVVSNESVYVVTEPARYSITVYGENNCSASDDINIAVGNEALRPNFLMASNASLNDTIIMIEMSNMDVDNIEWEYKNEAFEDVTSEISDEDYLLCLNALQKGTYFITMHVSAGGCVASETKQIDIYDMFDDYEDFQIGFDPLIKSFKVAPNPNSGEFFVMLKLREEHEVEIMIYSVSSTSQIDYRKVDGADNYNEHFNIREWPSGMYMITIIVGSEKKMIKVLYKK